MAHFPTSGQDPVLPVNVAGKRRGKLSLGFLKGFIKKGILIVFYNFGKPNSSGYLHIEIHLSGIFEYSISLLNNALRDHNMPVLLPNVNKRHANKDI